MRLKNNLLGRKILFLIARLSIFILVAILPAFILTGLYMRHLLVLTVIFSILALSFDVIVGHMGQFSFGHQAFFGLGAYTTGIMSATYSIPVWVTFFAGIAFAGILGLLVGLISLKKARGFLLGIITLGLGQIAWLIVMKWSNFTGGNQGLAGIHSLYFQVPFVGRKTLNTPLTYYYFALGFLIVSMYLIHIFKNSRLGRAISAVRENEQLALSIGVNPYQAYVAAFTVATALGGLAGVLYAHYMGFINPQLVSMYYMFWILVMVIVGGMRTYLGPIFGATLFVFLPEWLTVAKEFRMVFVGTILLVVVIFMRQGIIPYLKSFWREVCAKHLFKINK